MPLQCCLPREYIHKLGYCLNLALQSILGTYKIFQYYIWILKSNKKSQVDFALSMNYTKKELHKTGHELDMLKDQIQGDFAKADIYFNSLNVQTMAEERKYTVAMCTN